jgi:hypothetical protein
MDFIFQKWNMIINIQNPQVFFQFIIVNLNKFWFIQLLRAIKNKILFLVIYHHPINQSEYKIHLSMNPVNPHSQLQIHQEERPKLNSKQYNFPKISKHKNILQWEFNYLMYSKLYTLSYCNFHLNNKFTE